MDEKNLWPRFNKYLRIYPEIGLSLDISRMRFSEIFLRNICGKLQQSLAEMSKLESGEIANPDEGRMVGHYWLRTPNLAPNENFKQEIKDAIEHIQTFSNSILEAEIAPQTAPQFTNALLVGIGGSALGPQLVSDALGGSDDGLELFFCDNTDPDGIARILSEIGDFLNETLVIVISKSGGTVETRNGMLEVKHAYEREGLDFGKHAVAITCEGSKLDLMAISDGWLRRFYIWDWVGGRTSIFSAVGLLPAALEGINIDQFLAGAHEMDALTRTYDPLDNPAALMAAMWHSAGKGKGEKDLVVIPYKDRLCLFSKYLQQLIMESLGKAKDRDGLNVNQGLAVYGNKGSTDQHAYVQQLRDGLNNFFVTFIEVLADYVPEAEEPSNLEVEQGVTSGDYLSGFYLGTRKALFEGGRDSMSIAIDCLTPKTLGALIALYERAVGLYANLININAYHQPGVEAGKKAAGKIIELQKMLLAELKATETEEGRTAEELSAAIGQAAEAESVYKILEHLSFNPARGVKRVSESRLPSEARYR